MRHASAGLGLAAMFAFSGCSLGLNGLGQGGPDFSPGPTPQRNVVFCDIERFGNGFDNTQRVCADLYADSNLAIPLTSAALALNTGMTSAIGLDKSPPAIGRCGSNGEVVTFYDRFPQGTPLCLNCGAQIPAVFADANAVCLASCIDLVTSDPLNPSPSTVLAFCTNHAHASTNVPVSGCPAGFANVCSDAGTLPQTFVDPRIFPEPVIWIQLTGVAASGMANNNLTQTSIAPAGQYTAQAVSQQQIASGDAYLEFSSGETVLSKVIGLQLLPQNCFQCLDIDPTPADISLALNLADDGRVYMLHDNTLVPGGDLNRSLTTYDPGTRFRITVTDQNDGTFIVQYVELVGSCTAGTLCGQVILWTDSVHGTYPIRVDTSFRDQGATLLDVRLVRIQ